MHFSRVSYAQRTCACFKVHGGFSRKKTERENDSRLRVSAPHSHCTRRRRRFHHVFPRPCIYKRPPHAFDSESRRKKIRFLPNPRKESDFFLVSLNIISLNIKKNALSRRNFKGKIVFEVVKKYTFTFQLHVTATVAYNMVQKLYSVQNYF